MATEPIVSATDPRIDTAPSGDATRRQLVPGTLAFTLTLSAAMATASFAIDSLLPAFDDIRTEFGLASDATDVAALVTAFIVGFGLGQLPAGLLADRFGRRPVLWGGMAIYLVGAVAAALAPSLGLMIVARFVWGFGAAGPRVAVMAMVRDAYSGAAMARQMSTITAVYLLVPMIAPAIGSGLVELGPWQLTIWLCVGFAVLVFVASTRLPATVPAGVRRELSGREIVASWRMVLAAPGTLGYLAATTVLHATFLSYIASSENIIDEVFGLKHWFAALFGVVAVGLAAANLLNGRFVVAFGLRRLLTVVPLANVGTTAALCALALATGGTPPFALFLPLLVIVLTAQHVTIVNISSAAMRPLGHVAGSGAAVIGATQLVCGSLLASLVDAQFDGTVTPFSVAFMISSVIAAAAVRQALNAGADLDELDDRSAPVVEPALTTGLS